MDFTGDHLTFGNGLGVKASPGVSHPQGSPELRNDPFSQPWNGFPMDSLLQCLERRIPKAPSPDI